MEYLTRIECVNNKGIVAYKKVFIPSPNLYRISEFIEKHVLKNLKIVGILYLLNYSDYCHVFCVTVSSITFSVSLGQLKYYLLSKVLKEENVFW